MAGLYGLFFLTLRAYRPDFRFLIGECEAGLGHPFGQLAAHGRVADFSDSTATGTDHEQVMRCATRIVAGAPGVDSIEAVNQAFIHQEVERAIDGWGGCPRVHGAHGVEQLVGFQTPTVAQQELKHFAPDGGEAAATLFTQRVGNAELRAYGVSAG